VAAYFVSFFVYHSVNRIILSSQEVASSIYALADGSLSDWFGGFLFSAGQQANEAVQGQLSSLSFTRSPINSYIVFFLFSLLKIGHTC